MQAIIRSLLILLAMPGATAIAEVLPEYKFIEEAFPDTEITAVRPSGIMGLLEMEIGAELYYVSADGKYLFQGDIYDISRKLNLTESARSRARLEQVEAFDDSESVVFAADDPLATVTVFTDIDCGYCRKLHREIDQYNARGISVRYLFFPRSGPGTESWRKAEDVWCADDRQDALTRAKNNEKVESKNCDASIVARHYEMVDVLALRGTPAILTEQGQLIIGYRTADEMLEILNSELEGV